MAGLSMTLLVARGAAAVAGSGPARANTNASNAPAAQANASPANDPPATRPDGPDVGAEVRAYCRWVEAKSSASTDLLVAPEIFALSGLLPTAMLADGPTELQDKPAGRLAAGLRYDLSDLYRASLRRDEADAACRRYAIKKKVAGVIEHADAIGQRQALQAKLDVLDDAVPLARDITKRLHQAVARRRRSDRELRAMQVRLTKLVDQTHQARHRLDKLGGRAPKASTAATSADALIARYLDADAHLADIRRRRRQAGAWHVDVVAGYDHRFGRPSSLPVFAGGQVSVDLGTFWQDAANERAGDARRRWQTTRAGGLADRLADTLRDVRVDAADHARRLHANRALLADLTARLKRLAEVNGKEAASYRNLVWFDYAQLLGQTAYLSAGLARMDAFLAAVDRPRRPGSVAPNDTDIALKFKPQAPPKIADRSPAPAPPDFPEASEQTINAAVHKLRPIKPQRMDIVLGKLAAINATKFKIVSPKFRAYFPGTDGRRGALKFTYMGRSGKTASFESGKARSQIGLKLRAQDGCNLLYVMWRIDPEQRIVVSTKTNPGQKMSAECGNTGYFNLRPAFVSRAPTVDTGDTYRLSAFLNDTTLRVFVDDKLVWKGDVGELAFDGYTGIRTDNATFEVTASAHR